MLEQIQIRDQELELHRKHLEEQVGIRTADLAKAKIRLEKELADREKTETVIFMSEYTDDAMIRHGALKKEMNFIQKPFSMEALTQKVCEVLDNTR